MEQPASSAASWSAVNRQKIWEFIHEVNYSILDVVSREDEEAYLSMDVATAQRSHQHLVSPMLSSCRHLFCDRCAPACLRPHCLCPVCCAGPSFWMSKSPLLEYQRHLDAGNSAQQLDEDFGPQTSGCLKFLFGL